MSTQSKQLLNAIATAAFALAATATTVTNAYAQSSTPAGKTGASSAATTAGALGATGGNQATPLTREQVQAAYFEARKNGTLIETESDLDVAQTRKHFAK